jgi:hypothetical protein
MEAIPLMSIFRRTKTAMFMAAATLLLLSVASVFGQDSSAPPPTPPPGGVSPAPNGPPLGRGRFARRENCWQIAGISPSIEQQGRQIEQNTHAQVMSVCGNSSIDPQQKHAQVRDLREQAIQQLRGLVPAEQADAYLACRKRRMGERQGADLGACPRAYAPNGEGGPEGGAPPPRN